MDRLSNASQGFSTHFFFAIFRYTDTGQLYELFKNQRKKYEVNKFLAPSLIPDEYTENNVTL